ncbi:hypothetical protein HanIR_Chr17g0850431 [Helianthus annuus]|nr:hypothetical protein HanIR_Chr17g0850431 [Helianthus annuus]
MIFVLVRPIQFAGSGFARDRVSEWQQFKCNREEMVANRSLPACLLACWLIEPSLPSLPAES